MDGVESKFETIGDAKLVENIMQVIFNGLFADEKFFADFAIAKTLRDKLYDFLLALAQ